MVERQSVVLDVAGSNPVRQPTIRSVKMLKNHIVLCPVCCFSHNFKRTSWYTFGKFTVAHYVSDDTNSIKACTQELILGDFDYNFFSAVFDLVGESNIPIPSV